MVDEACLPSNAYYPRTPDYTLCSGVHVCWSEHSDSSFVYGFMILNYGFGTMTATTLHRRCGLYELMKTSVIVLNRRCGLYELKKTSAIVLNRRCGLYELMKTSVSVLNRRCGL